MSAELSFAHCGAASRHLTTEETAETGWTTINALIVGTKNVRVYEYVDCQNVIYEGEPKEKGSPSPDEEPSNELMN